MSFAERARAGLRQATAVGFPWKTAGTAAEASMRGHARRAMMRRLPQPMRSVFALVTVILWPISSAYRSVRIARSYTKAGQELPAGSALRAWHAAVTANVPPVEFYAYRLWEPSRREKTDGFVYWPEIGPLLATLNRCGGDRGAEGVAILQDKYAFDDLCRANAIATPARIGRHQMGQGSGKPSDAADVWVKPRFGRAGVNAHAWSADADGFRSGSGLIVPASDLFDHLDDVLPGDYLVQPRLQNHASIEALSPAGLATVRVVTGRDGRGQIRPVLAVLYLVSPGRTHSVAGTMAAVCLKTGHCSQFYAPGYADPVAVHPTTRASFENVIVPMWDAVLDLAARAHQVLPGVVFVGWDVALSPTGPLLLEGNSGWGPIHWQRLTGRPLADTPFLPIASDLLARAPW